MNVLIFGASGFSGKAILVEALNHQHHVTVLVRNKSSISIIHDNLTILEGNVLDRKTVANSLKNQQIVVQCLGIGGKGNGSPNSFVSDANQIIMEEMQKQGVKRLIAMSNVGAGNSIAFQPRIFTKFILPYFMKWLKVIIDDKNIMEPKIMNSGLEWTIVRCPNIVDKPAKGNCHATLDGKGLKLSIALHDMARFMVAQIIDKNFIFQAPCISN